jgi:hypothetical protein
MAVAVVGALVAMRALAQRRVLRAAGAITVVAAARQHLPNLVLVAD